MAKKIWFVLYCVLMIGGIVLFLVFSPKLSNNTELNVNEPNEEQPENNKGVNNTNNEVVENFATKIKLNCEDELVVSVGSSVELLTGFITVEPAKYFAQMTYSLSKVSGAVNGISFANNIISAHAVGRYEIMFSVPKTNKEDINDKLYIQVVEKEDDNKVKLKSNNFTYNTTIPISEMLEISETYTNYTLENNQFLTYSNNQITFKQIGSSVLKFSINEPYLKYQYSFNYSVKPLSTSGIYIGNENDGVLEINGEIGEYFDIYYKVIFNSAEHSNQQIDVSLNNSTIIQTGDNFVLAPLITCKILTKGSVKLTITPEDNLVSPKEITIIIK